MSPAEVQPVSSQQEGFLRPMMQQAVQSLLEMEMQEGMQAGGDLELRVPQDRARQFSTKVFESYARRENALVAALAQTYVQGVSTRKVAAITEELCAHEFSAASISAITAAIGDGRIVEPSRSGRCPE